MSGGYFEYKQYDIGYMADEVEQLIRTNSDETLNAWGDPMVDTTARKLSSVSRKR